MNNLLRSGSLVTVKTLWNIGLCAVCQHVKIVKSAKGSTFVMCGLAKTDRRFNKYPPLPVIECVGYESKNQSDEEAD